MKTADSEKTILYIYAYSRFLLTLTENVAEGQGLVRLYGEPMPLTLQQQPLKDFKISQQSSCCLFATFCNFKRFGTLKIL